ncbi:MAG: redoxin domain-containing protein [Planctomycetes bacterium]|nr:redoxin domain-containing protein [Planctomycetota bacterium]
MTRLWRLTARSVRNVLSSPPVGLVVFCLLVSLLGAGKPTATTALAGEKEKPRRPAPSLDGGKAWLNTNKPISLADLKGRVVLLDFWTLCCINCIHTLPDLAKLEAKYPGVLVVIGIHSPKFDNEKNTESIRKAVLRYQIRHPVCNDADMAIWRRYGARSWPTLVLIDPDGNYYGQVSGEGVYEVLDEHIDKLVKDYKAKKSLKNDPLPFELIEEKTGPLCFPGKVLADATSNRLFIADSTHHRIVITSLDGKKIAVAGSGTEGFKDGGFAEARFSDPQGMCLSGETLYVADRKNHSLRALNLRYQTVKTVAGRGEQDRRGRARGGPALQTGLNSPWDLHLHNGTVFIAMAGHHQIWTYDPAAETVAPYAGDGSETLEDGPLAQASFAQPSGLTSDGKNLYVADSEISAIRSVPLNGKGLVRTIVGEGLFEFGDQDGEGKAVRLQHALGVAHFKGNLYVADTYNSKIKRIDPENRTCETFLGDPAGWLKPKMFNEPGGLSFAGNKLYIADTNNHRVQVVDMESRIVRTLELQGVEPPPRDTKKK